MQTETFSILTLVDINLLEMNEWINKYYDAKKEKNGLFQSPKCHQDTFLKRKQTNKQTKLYVGFHSHEESASLFVFVV